MRTLVRNCIVKVLQNDSRRPCGYASSLDRAVCRARPVEIVKVVQPPGSSFENHLHLPCTYLCPYALVSLSSYRVTRFPRIELNSFRSPPRNPSPSPSVSLPFSNYRRDRYRFFFRLFESSRTNQGKNLSKFWVASGSPIRALRFQQ